MSKANETFAILELKGLPKDTFAVVSFSGTETISAPFTFNFDVVSSDQDIDFQKVLGKPAHATITGMGGERHVHGIVRRIEETSRSPLTTRYAIVVVPAVWRLSLRQTSRIFQEKSVPTVVSEVLAKADVPSDERKMTVKAADHPDWEYCVQYRESDFAFVSRLLEQEGIFYFFEHDADRAVLRMGDAPSNHPPCPSVRPLPVRPASGMTGKDEETVLRLVVAEEVRPDAAAVGDYNFKKPLADLTAVAHEGPGLGTEVYDAPGEYDLPDEGQQVAKLRLQELRATRRVCSGETTCNRLLPGHTFEVAKHPRGDLNGKYMVLEVTQHGTQPQALREEGSGLSSSYTCSFSCIPADVPFRPRRGTPRPLAQGAQTAIVVGPPGEEVHTDEFGRIKVQFHWDREGQRNERSSCWMRVAQTWAGSGWGSFIVPRIDQEVIVEFLDGDPDQPIVTGCVYNGDNRPQYAAGAGVVSGLRSNTHKGSGYNEMSMDDTAGKEKITIHGQFDMNTTVEHDQTTTAHNCRTDRIDVDDSESVGANQSLTVGKNRTKSIGVDETIVIGSSRSSTVGKNETATVTLQRTHTVGVNETISVGGAQEVTVGALQAITVGAAQQTRVGANRSVHVDGAQTTTVGKDDALKVAKNWVVDAGDSVTIKTGSASITMKKDGTIVLKGKDIKIEGSGKINVKASSDVVIKGSKVGIN